MIDLRYALRQLLKAPAFSAIAIATLALGIGANTAIFSVVESALLRPLPFPAADRLVRVHETFEANRSRANALNLSRTTLQQWRAQTGAVFSGIGAGTAEAMTVGLTNEEPPRTVPVALITANFLDVLGLAPVIGRNFTAAEDRPHGPPVILIGYDFWQHDLAGRRDVLGQTIRLNDAPYQVIGVMPKTFRHPYRAAVWLPLRLDFAAGQRRSHYLYGVARLQPGVSVAQADAAVRTICAGIKKSDPDQNNPAGATIVPLRESFTQDLRPKLLLIGGAALCALLVAAANFAGLMLARVIERGGEMSVRAALGATPGRLVRQGIVQTSLFAALGTMGGLLLALWLTPALFAISPEGADATGSAIREFDYGVRLDWPVFAFAAGAMLLIGVGFGLLPAWRAARVDLRTAMTQVGRGSTLDRGTQRLLGGLIVLEIAMALALLTASFALTKHFRAVATEPWGFATEHRVLFSTTFPRQLFSSPQEQTQAIERTFAEVGALPGVRAVSATWPSPVNAAWELFGCTPEGSSPPEPRGYYFAYRRSVRPNYFATIGQALQRGRAFTDADRAEGAHVCIVNESFARRFWPNENPLGKRVKQDQLQSAAPWWTVVGVVADMKAVADPDDGEIVGTFYLPHSFALASGEENLTFVIDAETDRSVSEDAIRAAVARVDQRLSAYSVGSLGDATAQSWVTERFLFVLVSLFGGLALVLAAVGVYGLLALQVARRTREFGVRMALGATASALLRLVAAQGARLLAVGFLAGAFASWLVMRFAHHQWPEVPAADATVWLGAALVLAVAVAIACWIPARRAAGVDPVVALRAD